MEEEPTARLARAVAGEPAAIQAVIEAVRPGLFRYCRSRLASHEQAEDVVQEVCIAVLKALPRYRDTGAHFEAFVFAIAARQVALAHRRNFRQRDLPHETLPDTTDPSIGPAEYVERLADIARAQALISYLPERQQDILLMRVAAGLSVEEVASTLSMTAGAVRVAQHRALAQLRAQIAAGTADE